jgi:DNA-directed RNA polymerase subunit RPC12/RpoP
MQKPSQQLQPIKKSSNIVKALGGIKNKLQTLSYKCEHCGKYFAKEKTLAVHVCEQKRRYLSKNEKHVQAGLLTYQRFYDITQKGKTQKTFDDFATSPYYTAFVKFGSFLVNTAPIYPERFIDFVVRSGVKLDHWCRDELYDSYISELIKIEPADGAIQRSIQTMMDWADNNSASWEHYFAYVNLNRATHDIKEGLISPWLVLNTKAGKDMLKRMNDEQLEIIGSVIDPQYWMRRFKNLPADLELVKDIIKEAKIQ